MSAPQPPTGDELAALSIPERSCGYTLTDLDGEEIPCDRPGVSWRWYQGHEHEDALDRACIIHENTGGILMSRLVAEIERLRAQVERVESFAQSHAISAHALGRTDHERKWLDLLAILERPS